MYRGLRLGFEIGSRGRGEICRGVVYLFTLPCSIGTLYEFLGASMDVTRVLIDILEGKRLALGLERVFGCICADRFVLRRVMIGVGSLILECSILLSSRHGIRLGECF